MNQTLHVRLDSEPISKLPSIELRQRRIGEPIVLQEDELVDGASTSPAGPCPAAKRRKVCQACTNCQKGHMSCDESRPCQRCIKRGLAATCQNPQKKPTTKACLSCPVLIRPAPPKPESSFVFPSLSSTKPASRSLSRELLSLPPSRANSKSPSGSPALSSPSQLQPQPQIKIPTVSIQRPIEVSRIASPLPSSSALAHGFDQAPSVLTDSVLLSSLMSLAAAATAQDLPEAVATSTPSSPMSGSLPLSVLPHDYQSGYNRARSYMATHISVAGQDKINKVILTSQAVFSLLVKSPPISELIQVERRFRDLVRNYWQQQQQQQHQQQHQSRESAKIATAVWRRTGEIYGASHLFLQLLHLTPDQVVEGRTGIYEFMTEDSLVSYWERYGQLSFGKSNEVRVGPCILRNRNLPGAELHYSNLSIEFHHDHWGVPLMIIGTFLILDL
ncbi:uncharacterized protein BJ171DRAFT_423003, partial [Polychytrium aggregatum]|uniref:uncharacterized protein n=1 Tax=Polychytrium aggregatum TaxID=110093 RepID=UPI0022FE44C0